jgi:HEPN domain-containing protein
MQFTAEQYYQVSLERMKQAHGLYHQGAYSLSMYCSGLAVEALLRAFRFSDDTSFEGRHNLSSLLKASGLLRVDDQLRRKKRNGESVRQSVRALQAAMNEVVALWHNNLRFASEASLGGYLKKIGRVRGIKGDPAKKCALDLVNAAQTVIDRGITLWTSKKKS